MVDAVTVRPAEPEDVDAIGAIYAHHVRTGVATFELEPPGRDELLRRMAAVTDAGLPYLVAVADGQVAGYAYCAPWKSRRAYRFTVEDSVYVAPDAAGRGVGGALLDSLLDECAQVGIRQVIAVIVDADAAASLALHRRRGFTDAGRLSAVGFKHDRWLDTVLLQKALPHSS
ncbi:N-acetyltransferase [Mycolicibacterium vaccae]|uniref:Phosphinothricin N-acetyltransferase n=1 Tax=Mycolicibacterium vaccae ATCC 25954 TaxID=1194972 RepID=K0USU0_MYCVA|nr:GCN5 family acetyltransferase [Mycolicibacterium vaccae 95051]EJZ10212.1 phosphinothricin N-acetyltransferase [Mycolicibacterium vaccae ATCC 25954]MCV7062078.1 N-acetyltransferase [Mycolicibacterium vaccae]